MACASLLCWSVCVVSSVEGLMSSACLNTSCIFTNGFPFRLPLVHTFGVSSPGGR